LCWGCCLAWLGCQPRALEVAGSNPASPMSTLTLYLAPRLNKARMSTVVETAATFSSPYQIFRYSIRSELTRKYYERRIKRFFDYIDFLSTETLEIRCNLFAEKALVEKNLALSKIVQFLQHQKERV
jgi:hypothetical protein